jgi:hypothetical protein
LELPLPLLVVSGWLGVVVVPWLEREGDGVDEGRWNEPVSEIEKKF